MTTKLLKISVDDFNRDALGSELKRGKRLAVIGKTYILALRDVLDFDLNSFVAHRSHG
jgi:hypothetical protein